MGGLGARRAAPPLPSRALAPAAARARRLAEILRKAGIIVGIKVDKGTVELAGTDGEVVVQGHDDLAKRCQKYYAAGARFAKWCVGEGYFCGARAG